MAGGGWRPVAVVGAAVLVTVAAYELSPPNYVDDAYITLHNARLLAFGGPDPNFPGVSPLVGSTSLVHVSLEALALRVFEPYVAVWVTLWIGAALYTAGLWSLSRPLPGWWRALLVLTGLTAGLTSMQLFYGLETGYALAGVVWGIVLSERDEGRGSPALPILCGLLPFVRPELSVLSALLMGARVVRLLRTFELPRAARYAGLDAAIVIGCAAPWVVWLWLETGAFVVPPSAWAKRAFYADAARPAALRWYLVALHLGHFAWPIVGPPALAAALWITTPVGRLLLAFGAAFVGAYYVNYATGLAHYEHRYLYIFVPCLMYGLVLGLARTQTRFVRRLSAALCLAGLGYALIQLPSRYISWHDGFAGHGAELERVARWLREEVPTTAPVLVHDVGYLSFATTHRLVDLVGLKRPASVEANRRWALPTGGRLRSRALAEIAAAERPEYAVFLPDWSEVCQLEAGLASAGWRVSKVPRQDAPPLGYAFYRLTRPSLPGGPRQLP